MTKLERFEEILTRIPFDHNDLSGVNREENLPLFRELFQIYINSSPTEQNSIEKMVQNEGDLIDKFVNWIPPGLESDPPCYVKYRLLSATIRDGLPDFRDDLLELMHLWDFLEENGLNPQ